MQMKQRFESVKDIAFIELLDCKHFHLYDCYRTNALFKQVFFKRVRRKSNCRPGNNNFFVRFVYRTSQRYLFFTCLTLTQKRVALGFN